jgi:SHS2 domain-containing protein
MSSWDRLGPSGGRRWARTIEAEGIDEETLLVNWLNGILYLEQTRGEVYDRFQILKSRVSPSFLAAP